MASFTVTIQDGGLGLVPPSAAGAAVKLGICSDGLPNTLYSAGNSSAASSQLGQGPLVEAMADTLNQAGGPQYAMPLTPASAGTAGSTTYSGPGTGTVTASAAPHKQILLKIETGGAPGTMTFRYSVGGAAYSAPKATTAGAYSYLVPGTLSTVTFADQTYTTLAVWTITTAGAISLSGTGTVGWVTQAASPLDVYSIQVTITTSGALGAGRFTYSLDGGNTVSAAILIPSGAAYVISNSGVVLTFAGTFTADVLPYAITTTTAGFTTSEVNTAMTALLALATEWGFVHVVGQASSAAGAASMCSTLDTHMTAAETAFRYVFGVVECPTSESDATVAAAFASFSSTRIMVCAGDIGHQSSLSSRVIRRNCATVVTTKLSKIRVGLDPAWVEEPPNPAKNVRSLYRDEAATPLLDAARFTTMTSLIGVPGYFITHGNMMASPGSDYSLVQYRRVMDRACQVTRAGLLPVLNQALRVNKTTGYIDERDAQAIESRMKKKLQAAIIDTDDAVDAVVVINRTDNILSTRILRVSIRVTPDAYAGSIEVNIGFQNPALAAA